MYFRANERSKGNGLGLYIAKKAVEKLNGKIWFQSNYRVGTTFTIEIPNIS
jgi:signal transduction histidine kinase